MKIFSKAQIKQIEQNGFNQGIPSLRMMENAGAAVAKCIRENYPESKYPHAVVLCGKGNNGGDGFVVARKLNESGYKVAVVLTHGRPSGEESAEMLMRLRDLPVNVLSMDTDTERCAKIISGSELLVDAIFGIGFTGEPDKNTSLIFRLMNASKAKTVSVDIPSGIDADSAYVDGEAVRADLTATPIGLKKAQVLYPAAEYCGEVKLVNIGLTEACYGGVENEMYSLSKEDIASFFKKRNPCSHKGDFGRVLIFAGSFEMPGAAVLAAKAAVNSGAGLVTLAFPEKAYFAVAPQVPECVLLPLESNENGRFSLSAFGKVKDAAEKADVILIGCGMGQDTDTRDFFFSVIKNAHCPVVIDADGLNILATDINSLSDVSAPTVLTPHPAEAARLLGTETVMVQSSRFENCKKLCEMTKATVALKGAGTLVMSEGDSSAYINTTGNAGMAAGGSGDVLAGIITSFIAQGLDIDKAVKAGVFIHGFAGDEVAKLLSMMGTTPLKIIDMLPETLKSFE